MEPKSPRITGTKETQRAEMSLYLQGQIKDRNPATARPAQSPIHSEHSPTMQWGWIEGVAVNTENGERLITEFLGKGKENLSLGAINF